MFTTDALHNNANLLHDSAIVLQTHHATGIDDGSLEVFTTDAQVDESPYYTIMLIYYTIVLIDYTIMLIYNRHNGGIAGGFLHRHAS